MQLLVASYSAHQPFSPRGARTRAVVDAASAAGWKVELVAGPAAGQGGAPATGGLARRARRALGGLHKLVLVDKQEPWARARLARLRTDADVAYLIGYPFSVLGIAGRRLARTGVPYVVDIGDPWILTAGPWTVGRHLRGVAMIRARRMERDMWTHAAGGVVTSQRQADALLRLFPDLRLLVRPNGYEPTAEPLLEPAAPVPGLLRLAHFGNMYDVRIDVRPLLERLVASGLWQRIELSQYGNVWDPAARASLEVAGIGYEELAMRPPEELPRVAAGYDAVLVIANRSGLGPPSKVFQYLTLPAPRIAVVGDPATDETAAYVTGRPGWLALAADDPQAPRLLAKHTARRWSAAELAPSVADGWPVVAADILEFLRLVPLTTPVCRRTGSRHTVHR